MRSKYKLKKIQDNEKLKKSVNLENAITLDDKKNIENSKNININKTIIMTKNRENTKAMEKTKTTGNINNIRNSKNIENIKNTKYTKNTKDTKDTKDIKKTENTKDIKKTENTKEIKKTENTKEIKKTENTKDVKKTENTKNTKSSIIDLENKNKQITPNLNSSFSKEFTNISEDLYDDDDDNNLLAQSYSYSQINKYRQEVLKEPLNIILDSYLSASDKNNRKRKIKFITPKDISKLNNQLLTKQLNLNKEKEEYLEIRNNLQDIRQFNENFKMYLQEKMIQDFYKAILNVNYGLNVINANINIGPLFTLERLFEEIAYNNQLHQIKNEYYLNEKYNKFKPFIYKYRKVKGDGNCYYRAVMFRYMELIILNQNISLLKKIILDMKECFNSKEIQSRLYIKMDTTFKPELHLKIMILILKLLEERKVEEAHQIFVKCILSCAIFDYGLILYFRYIIYLYIKENENKLFSKIFPVKIGNLLPSTYENEKGEFEFNKFYTNYLLKMFIEAEKIIIYLTPFILEVNLDIIIFEDNEEQIIKRFSYDEKYFDTKIQNNVITLLNRSTHYEIIYTLEQYNKYPKIYSIYEPPEINESENNMLEKSCDSGFFLLQTNRNDNNKYEKKEVKELNNKDNNIVNHSVNKTKNEKNIENNNNSKNASTSKNSKKDVDIKSTNLVNKDNNEAISDKKNINNKELEKKSDTVIKNDIETPFGHPECEENETYLDEIDNMFDKNNIKKINLSCLSCKKKLNELIKNKYSLCSQCLEKYLLTLLKEDYSKYLINRKLNDTYKIKEIKISNYSINLKEVLELLNIINEEDLMNLLKNYVCLKCCRVIEKKDNKMVDFPCQCCICNRKEFENYFMDENEISNNYKCICGYEYESKDLYDLTIQCNKIGCNSIILIIINIFNKSILSKGCCVCGKDIEREKIIYEPENKSSFCFENYLSLNNLQISLDHFMCRNCKSNSRNQKFDCYYCNRTHILLKIK